MDIEITIHQTGDDVIAVMKLKGDITASNFMEVVTKAREIYNNPAGNLILDLSAVTSVSTTGVVALHKIALIYSGISREVDADDSRPDYTHSSNARKYVKLLNPQPAVDKALEKAGMKLFFKVFQDLDSALTSF
jgi:anti-anti-sigma regulatory factor